MVAEEKVAMARRKSISPSYYILAAIVSLLLIYLVVLSSVLYPPSDDSDSSEEADVGNEPGTEPVRDYSREIQEAADNDKPIEVNRQASYIEAEGDTRRPHNLVTVTSKDGLYVGTDVTYLGEENFKSEVFDDYRVWVVKFYAPWCGYSRSVVPAVKQAAAATKGIIRVGAVNCDEHDPLSVDYNISGYPTLILFGEDKEKPIEFKDEITAKAITEAAFALLPDVTVVSSNNHEEFLSLSPSLPRALLFTPRAATAPLLRALALDLKGRMRVGEVRGREEEALMRAYGLVDSDLPALVALPNKVEGEGKRVRYKGDLVHGGMLKFLEQFVSARPTATM